MTIDERRRWTAEVRQHLTTARTRWRSIVAGKTDPHVKGFLSDLLAATTLLTRLVEADGVANNVTNGKVKEDEAGP